MEYYKKNCAECKKEFEISDSDLEFYKEVSPLIAGKKYAIPAPKLCPDCRAQRRMMFRNFFNLYHRSCDLTGKKIISAYSTGVPFPVYELHEWWGDKWDGLDYGRDVDFEWPFFEQIKELLFSVPRMNVGNAQCENSDYCNMSLQSRNCYLVFGNVNNEDCCYGHIVWSSKNCYDCLYTYKCEFCYDCVDCLKCYNVAFSVNAENCSDCKFLVNCTGCRNCFGCVGLNNKQYYIHNEPYSKEDYEAKMAEIDPGNRANVAAAKEKLKELRAKLAVKYYHGFGDENVSGDYLYNSKNSFDSYDLKNCEDVKYCATLESFNNCHDCNYSGPKAEFCYNSITVGGCNGAYMCHFCVGACANLFYCDSCSGCKNCFGCVGLKSKQFCVLNKQYSKNEYEELVPKLIMQMGKTGEWGEFFPMNLSIFAYNETIAGEYYPLAKEEVLAKGLKWRDDDSENMYKGPKYQIPENIKDVADEICNRILVCEATGKLYKVIPQELEFYRKMKYPIPLKSFEQRHKERMAMRNPRKLWKRSCAKCGKEIETSYCPERLEVVYCEECYLKNVY